MFCYVTRTGDVLGVSKTFHFKNPGISFTDPDTFLVEGDMLASINQTDISQISIDMPLVSCRVQNPKLNEMNYKSEVIQGGP